MSEAAPVEALAAAVPEPDSAAAAAARSELDRKTKPRGSLGRLEELAVQLAAAEGRAAPAPLSPVVVVAAADHGIAVEGVSAYPQEVTRQMLSAFVSGGAAICVLARAAGAELVVVDAGVTEPFGHPAVRDLRLGPGTASALLGPAMTRTQAEEAIRRGADLGKELAANGGRPIALGEMGIGNTTTAAALVAALTGAGPAEVCGPGTGLDAAGIDRKIAVVERILERHQPGEEDPVGALAAVGGFELGVLAGVTLGAAAARRIVVLDGFITGAAALVACRLAPRVRHFLVASHRSPEPGHRVALAALGLDPLLDLGLRLGEGTGAALGLPLLSAARAILVEMATFAAAGVTDAGR